MINALTSTTTTRSEIIEEELGNAPHQDAASWRARLGAATKGLRLFAVKKTFHGNCREKHRPQ